MAFWEVEFWNIKTKIFKNSYVIIYVILAYRFLWYMLLDSQPDANKVEQFYVNCTQFLLCTVSLKRLRIFNLHIIISQNKWKLFIIIFILLILIQMLFSLWINISHVIVVACKNLKIFYEFFEKNIFVVIALWEGRRRHQLIS